MPADRWQLFAAAKRKLLDGTLDIDGGTWKMALITSATRVHANIGTGLYTDFSASEVANGNGYTTGGAAVTPNLATSAINSGIAGVSAITGGSGYSGGATVAFTGGGATTQATGTLYFVGGILIGVIINTPGVGYTSLPTITITPISGGTAASFTVFLGTTVAVALATPAVSWAASTFSAKYAVIYSTAGGNHALAFCDLEAAVAAGLSPSAATLTVTTAGLFDLL